MKDARLSAVGAMAIFLLFSTVIVIAGCSAGTSGKTGLNDTAPPSAGTDKALGPFGRGTVVTSQSVEFELLNVQIGDVKWIRRSERMAMGVYASRTPAKNGYRYVDVTVRVKDLRTSDPRAGSVPLGDPYVIADGRRFNSVDSGTEKRGAEVSTSTYRLITEYEIPEETRKAVMYLPTSKKTTQTISFQLW